MSFKGLYLNRDKIEQSIKSFPTFEKLSGPIINNTQHAYTIKIKGEKNDVILNIYHALDGKTTINTSSGKNTKLSEEIAKFIVKNCEIKDNTKQSIYLRNISKEQFNMLKQYIIEHGCSVEDGSKLVSGVQYKIVGPQKDNVSLNLYNNGSFQIQGKGKMVKGIVVEALTTILPFKEIIQLQLTSLEVDIPIEKVIESLKQILPTSYNYLGDTLVAIISPSISLKTLDIDLKDYSAFVFPALRGLEGYIKKMFLTYDIRLREEVGSKFVFNKIGDKFELILETQQIINDNNAIKALELSYNYYYKHRHGLFHIDNGIETSRILEKKSEADDILQDIFSIIEQSYAQIV